MTRESDIGRATLGARMALGGQCSERPVDASHADASLQALLGDIGNRRVGQTARLMRWLEQQGTGQWSVFEPEAEAGSPSPPGGSSQPLDADGDRPVQAGPAASPPASSADGVAVIERIDVADDLIRFRVQRPLDFEFNAGESVKVGLADLQRAYSIVSAPHEPVLEFFVELAPGGRMSERLRYLNVGDRLSLGTAKGGIGLDESGSEHVMIATVTGINPFISLLRDYLHQGRSGHRFHILQGASYQNEFGYRDELASLAAAHPDVLRYTPTVSRPEEAANSGWTGRSGRVDAIVEDYLAANGLEPTKTRVYACGHSGMLDSVTSRCKAAGFSVRTESYD